MNSDLLGQLVPLRDALRYFPKNRRGRHPHLSCLFRWAKHGKRARCSKNPIRLETWLAGTCLCTTPAAIADFIAKLSAAANLPTPEPTDAEAEAEAAGERLRATVFRRSGK